MRERERKREKEKQKEKEKTLIEAPSFWGNRKTAEWGPNRMNHCIYKVTYCMTDRLNERERKRERRMLITS